MMYTSSMHFHHHHESGSCWGRHQTPFLKKRSLAFFLCKIFLCLLFFSKFKWNPFKALRTVPRQFLFQNSNRILVLGFQDWTILVCSEWRNRISLDEYESTSSILKELRFVFPLILVCIKTDLDPNPTTFNICRSEKNIQYMIRLRFFIEA